MLNSEKLAATFARKEAAGLVDVKFTLVDKATATFGEVCGEVLRMYRAIDAGLAVPFSFNDFRWRDTPADPRVL
jgi:hypothetical protein